MNEFVAALERAEKELARLHDENSRLRLELALQPFGERRLRKVIEHDPGNYLGRIEHLWAFLSSDEGGEGVCAGPLGGVGVVPYIAADEARLASLGPLAREVARRFGKVVLLAKFGSREDVERIEP
jgi:hypothetical protein